MGKNRVTQEKKPHLFAKENITTATDKSKDSISKNGLQQVFLQQSVTILAFKDKSNNSTTAPDALKPRVFLGFLSEDIPLFVGAIIGATLIIVLFLLILTIWKCCCRMQLLKKKKYWLNPKDKASSRNKHIFPSVVQSNSVLFLGLKSTHIQDNFSMEKSSENLHTSFVNNIEEDSKCTIKPVSAVLTPHCEDNLLTGATQPVVPNGPSLPASSIPVLNSSKEPNYVNCNILAQHLDSSLLKQKNPVVFSTQMSIPNPITQCDESQESSPACFHRTYYSGTFDQHSLYSCASHMGSEMDLKSCSLAWSSFNIRPSSTADCYYDIFQRANLCKKRKNRMRSDIAAAIALNRSQSTQLNKEKDTDILVENEVEIVFDERTTL